MERLGTNEVPIHHVNVNPIRFHFGDPLAKRASFQLTLLHLIAVKPVWFRLPGNRRGTRMLSTRCHQMIMHGDLGAGRLIDALNGSVQHCVERGIRLVGRQPLDQRP